MRLDGRVGAPRLVLAGTAVDPDAVTALRESRLASKVGRSQNVHDLRMGVNVELSSCRDSGPLLAMTRSRRFLDEQPTSGGSVGQLVVPIHLPRPPRLGGNDGTRVATSGAIGRRSSVLLPEAHSATVSDEAVAAFTEDLAAASYNLATRDSLQPLLFSRCLAQHASLCTRPRFGR